MLSDGNEIGDSRHVERNAVSEARNMPHLDHFDQRKKERNIYVYIYIYIYIYIYDVGINKTPHTVLSTGKICS